MGNADKWGGVVAAHSLVSYRCIVLVRHFKRIRGLHDSFSALFGVIVAVLLVWATMTSWKNKQGLWRLMTLSTVGAVENELTRYHRAEQYLPIYRLAFSFVPTNWLHVRWTSLWKRLTRRW